MGFLHTAAALGVVPGLLGFFRLLTRVPQPTAPPSAPPSANEPDPAPVPVPASVADEAERWLHGQP